MKKYKNILEGMYEEVDDSGRGESGLTMGFGAPFFLVIPLGIKRETIFFNILYPLYP